MSLVAICKCDHEEFNHNFVQSCFKCDCNKFIPDNLKMLEKAIGPTVSVQKSKPPLNEF